MTTRYIITGTPGSGKTSVIRALELAGITIVSEAATDLIALLQAEGNLKPWKYANFIDRIVGLQKLRQINTDTIPSALHFYDRSPICTYALALYLNFEPTQILMDEIDRILNHGIYERRVFFLENLGFITNTPARQINFEEALKFESIHREIYTKFGYECIAIPALSINKRVKIILDLT